MSNRIEEIFKECGAILNGHFVLKSLEHSDKYVEKGILYSNPIVFGELCREIAQEVSAKSINIDVVVGSVPIGAAMAQWVAYHLGEIHQKKVYSIFAEKNQAGGQVFRKCFHKYLAGKNVLVVDDVLTSGATIKELLKAIILLKGQTVGVAVICNRGDLTSENFYVFPLISLLKMKLQSWQEKDCPLCLKKVPIDSKF